MDLSEFSEEQLEMAKIVIGILLIVPGWFLLRAFFFLILPRSWLKFFFMGGGKPTMPEESLRKRNRFWED